MPDIALRGLSPELHQALKRAAERNHRSLNGEIVSRLERSVIGTTVDVDDLLARVDRRRDRGPGERLDESLLRLLKEEGRP